MAAAVTRGARSRRVVAAWSLLAVLLALIAAIEGTSLLTAAPPERTGRLPVFDFDEADLGAVEVLWEGRGAGVVRDAAGLWLRHDGAHRHGPGDAGPDGRAHRADPQAAREIADALAVAARMRADRRIPVEGGLETYGLAKPAIMVAFYPRRDGAADYTRPLDVLYVGDLLTTEFTYYALRDGDRALSLIPRYQIAALLALAFGKDAAPEPLPERRGETQG